MKSYSQITMVNGKLKHHIWRKPAVKDLIEAKKFPNLIILEFKCDIIHNKGFLQHNQAIHIIKYSRR